MDSITFDYPPPGPGRIATSPHSQLVHPDRAKYAVHLFPECERPRLYVEHRRGLRQRELYLGPWALQGQLQLLMFYDERGFGGDVVNERLCGFREAVSTSVSPDEVKVEEGVVRLLQRSHDGRTKRPIQDRTLSCRRSHGVHYRDQQVGCHRCSPTHEGLDVRAVVEYVFL